MRTHEYTAATFCATVGEETTTDESSIIVVCTEAVVASFVASRLNSRVKKLLIKKHASV
jgi:deoxyhypusine synthase